MSTTSSHRTKPSTEPMDLTHDRLCPFCGTVNSGFDAETPCPRCLISDTPDSRKAARDRVGPWFVLHSRNPSAPGMSYDAMLGLIRRGQLKPTSIVRTPTTNQLWQFAASVRGLSREFGVCCDCAKAIKSSDETCPHCHHSQTIAGDPDAFLAATETAISRPSSTEPDSPDESFPFTPPPARDTLSMQSLATAFSVAYDDPGKHRKFSFARFVKRLVIALFLLAVAGFALLCFAEPGFYEKSLKWVTELYQTAAQSIRQKIGY